MGLGARLRPFFGGPVITASEHWEKAEPELLLDSQSLSSIFVVSARIWETKCRSGSEGKCMKIETHVICDVRHGT